MNQDLNIVSIDSEQPDTPQRKIGMYSIHILKLKYFIGKNKLVVLHSKIVNNHKKDKQSIKFLCHKKKSLQCKLLHSYTEGEGVNRSASQAHKILMFKDISLSSKKDFGKGKSKIL